MTQPLETVQDIEWWQVEQLRVTTFHATRDVGQMTQQWWEKVVGSKPDQVITRPKERTIQEFGILDGKQLMLISRPDRVDWHLQELIGMSNEPIQTLTAMGALPGIIDSFSRVAGEWLNINSDVTRLAFGAILVKPVADRSTANRELSRFLPNVKLANDSQDFLYQINRPRMSKAAPKLKINRLMKWSVMQAGTLSIGNWQMSGPIVATGRSQLACRLELDINTAAESSDFIVQQDIGRIFLELVELGREIAIRGDIL